MSFKLHFLGTGAMVPTKDRNHLSVALEHEGNIYLFDCGESTQKQIKTMKLPIGKIKKIFISHWHGDHTLGLGGLIQTLSNTDNMEKIEIHGPQDSKTYVDHILKSSIFESKIKIDVIEHIPKEKETIMIYENSEIEIKCAKLSHSVPCLGYLYKIKDKLNIELEKLNKIAPELEKSPLLSTLKMGLPIDYQGKRITPEEVTYTKDGKSVAFIFDTRPCTGINLLAKNVNYLVIEATHLYTKHSNKAEETDHMTAKESAEIALENDVETLIITHFSQRYKDIKPLEDEAKEIFPNTITTHDLMTIKLK